MPKISISIPDDVLDPLDAIRVDGVPRSYQITKILKKELDL